MTDRLFLYLAGKILRRNNSDRMLIANDKVTVILHRPFIRYVDIRELVK